MTFHVRETVWTRGKLIASALLVPTFNGRFAAVGHILLLQNCFDRNGFDQKQDEWWARHNSERAIHRWTIEEDDED